MTCTRHTQRTRTALAHCNARYAVVADEAGKAVWEGRPAGRGGWQGGGGQGGVAGRVGWPPGGGQGWGVGSGGGQGRVAGWLGGGWWSGGVDLQGKECSGVNIV